MRLKGKGAEDDADKRRPKAQRKGPTFTIIKRLPAGVAVEEARQTAARAIADLLGGAR